MLRFQESVGCNIIQKALDESRIEVFALRNRRLVVKLQTDFSLGKGEAGAIALALDEKAAQYPARTIPCQCFDAALASGSA
jgi:predicted nucleic acid-binding protein